MPTPDPTRAALARKLKQQQAQTQAAIKQARAAMKRRSTSARKANAAADADAVREALAAAKRMGEAARAVAKAKPLPAPGSKGLFSGLLPVAAASNPDFKEPAVRYASIAGPLWNPASGLPSPRDVTQGNSGDCYLLSALAAVARAEPGTLQAMITPTTTGYQVRFHRVIFGLPLPGGTVAVDITPELPVDANGDLVYARAGEGGALWVALFEKAFIKFEGDLRTGLSNGSYKGIGLGIEAGSPSAALASITGRVMPSTPAVRVTVRQLARAATRPVTLMSNISFNGDVGFTDDSKLIHASHAYFLESADEATGIVRIRNPHGWHLDVIELDLAALRRHFWLVQGEL